MKEMLDQIREEISISKCFGARLRKEGIKFWNYPLARWKGGRTSSADAVPKKPAGLFKCWTWIWLSCWIQAWIWMGDLPQENNMKWKTLWYPSLFQLHVLLLISFQADEQASLCFCLLLCCYVVACCPPCIWGASIFSFGAVTPILCI